MNRNVQIIIQYLTQGVQNVQASASQVTAALRGVSASTATSASQVTQSVQRMSAETSSIIQKNTALLGQSAFGAVQASEIAARGLETINIPLAASATKSVDIVSSLSQSIGAAATKTVGVVGGMVGGVKNYITDLGSHMKWASLFIGTMAVGIGSSLVQMAGGLEQTRVGFELLLKDDTKVRDALGFIKQWALETPFSVNQATDSFKRFLAITGDVPTTEKFMKNLGDAVVATGGNIDEFNFAARGMTQMMSMSKVRAQEMYQLVNANIPAFDILAKAVKEGSLEVAGIGTASQVAGMSLVEIKGALQDIGNLDISGAEAAKVFSEYFEKAYGGAAKKQTQTLVGQLGVLTDQIFYSAAALIGYNQVEGKRYGIYKLIGDALNTVNNFLMNSKGIFEDFGKSLEGQLVVWGGLGLAVGVFIGFISGILAPVIGAGLVFAGLGVIIGSVVEWLKSMGVSWNDLQKIVEPIIKTLQSLWDGFVKGIQSMWKESGEGVMKAFQTAFSDIGVAMGKVSDLITNKGFQDDLKIFAEMLGRLTGSTIVVGLWVIAQLLDLIAQSITKVVDMAQAFDKFVAGPAWRALIGGLTPSTANLGDATMKNWNDQLAKTWAQASGLTPKQHGGLVPGPTYAAVPILAHGGERVVPAMGAGAGGSGITLNIYNPVIDDSSRIDELSRRISYNIGRQEELIRQGAY